MDEQSELDQNYSLILQKALRGLANANAKVHRLLMRNAEEGYFMGHQPKGKIDSLAGEILRHIEEGSRNQEGEDENSQT